MKTWVVIIAGDRDRHWMGNAESATEAVLYARSRADLFADKYVVYDHDLNRFEVDRRRDGVVPGERGDGPDAGS